MPTSTLRGMSELSEPDPGGPQASGALAADCEQIDALPVLAHEARVVRGAPLSGALAGDRRANAVMLPAMQAAAVAAGGFVAGAAVVGLVQRRQRRSAQLSGGRRAGRGPARRGRAAGRGGMAGELVQIVGSRSLLVDVHLLGGSGADG